jgi:hypothetical protein
MIVQRRILTSLAGLSVLFACSLGYGIDTNPPVCKRNWQATVCGQETWNASQWLQVLTIVAGAGQTSGQLVLLPSNETSIDITLTTSTNSGDLALVALIDVQTFVAQNPNVNLDPVITACSSPDQTACNTAISNLAGSVSQDQLQKAAIWWHGCEKSNDTATKTFTGLAPRSGYVIAAKAEKGSSAVIAADLTHHASPPEPQVTPVCAAAQSGEMPADGTYVNKSVGQISLAVSPQHGGIVSDIETSIFSLVGRGSFKVDGSGKVTFSGTVSSSNCPIIPAPQHIPNRQTP